MPGPGDHDERNRHLNLLDIIGVPPHAQDVVGSDIDESPVAHVKASNFHQVFGVKLTIIDGVPASFSAELVQWQSTAACEC